MSESGQQPKCQVEQRHGRSAFNSGPSRASYPGGQVVGNLGRVATDKERPFSLPVGYFVTPRMVEGETATDALPISFVSIFESQVLP